MFVPVPDEEETAVEEAAVATEETTVAEASSKSVVEETTVAEASSVEEDASESEVVVAQAEVPVAEASSVEETASESEVIVTEEEVPVAEASSVDEAASESEVAVTNEEVDEATAALLVVAAVTLAEPESENVLESDADAMLVEEATEVVVAAVADPPATEDAEVTILPVAVALEPVYLMINGDMRDNFDMILSTLTHMLVTKWQEQSWRRGLSHPQDHIGLGYFPGVEP